MENRKKEKHAQFNEGKVGKCRIPGKDEWVHDYYNQELNQDEEKEFEDHLFDCDRCQDVLLMLDAAYTQLRINARQNAGVDDGRDADACEERVKKKRAKGAISGE